jgi:hypothetical protein
VNVNVNVNVKNLLFPTPQRFKPSKLFEPFARTPADDCLYRSPSAGVPVKMLRLPPPQKFNTFTTFNTFATFHNHYSRECPVRHLAIASLLVHVTIPGFARN